MDHDIHEKSKSEIVTYENTDVCIDICVSFFFCLYIINTVL